jgi:hypothetical protein
VYLFDSFETLPNFIAGLAEAEPSPSPSSDPPAPSAPVRLSQPFEEYFGVWFLGGAPLRLRLHYFLRDSVCRPDCPPSHRYFTIAFLGRSVRFADLRSSRRAANVLLFVSAGLELQPPELNELSYLAISPGAHGRYTFGLLPSAVLSSYAGRTMLDRSQHLKLFLTGSGDDQEDVDVVLADKRVQKQLNRHPVDWERLFKAVRRVSDFEFNSAQQNAFMWLFGRYR